MGALKQQGIGKLKWQENQQISNVERGLFIFCWEEEGKCWEEEGKETDTLLSNLQQLFDFYSLNLSPELYRELTLMKYKEEQNRWFDFPKMEDFKVGTVVLVCLNFGIRTTVKHFVIQNSWKFNKKTILESELGSWLEENFVISETPPSENFERGLSPDSLNSPSTAIRPKQFKE